MYYIYVSFFHTQLNTQIMSQEKSWRDKLKEGQSKFASLDAEFLAFCKQNPETGEPEMFITKGEVKKKVESLSGFLLGSYMKIGAYNNTLKISGNSTPYFTLDDIVTVYEKNQKIYSGTARVPRICGCSLQ